MTIIGVAAVLLMGLLAVLLSDRGSDIKNNSSPATQATPTESATKSEVRLYYVSLGNVANSTAVIGCGDGLVEKRELIDGLNNDIKATYERQLSIKDQAVDGGLYNALARSNLQLEDVRIESGIAHVVLTGELVTADNCDKARVRTMLERPALQFPDVNSVIVRVNGYLLEELF